MNGLFSTDVLGPIHALCATLVLAGGPVVFFSAKGTRFHRIAGASLALLMLAAAWSGFAIFDFNDGIIGPFHFFSVLTTFTVFKGVLAIRNYVASGEVKHLYSHYFFMCYSYMGFVIAGSNAVARIAPVGWQSVSQYYAVMIPVWIGIWLATRWLVQHRVFPRIQARYEAITA